MAALERSLAASGKDADPQESFWDFKGRGHRQAVISGRMAACVFA
jgi:hypothetical protein